MNTTESNNISLAKTILENPAKWQNMNDYNKFMKYAQTNKLTEGYLKDLIETSLNSDPNEKPLHYRLEYRK